MASRRTSTRARRPRRPDAPATLADAQRGDLLTDVLAQFGMAPAVPPPPTLAASLRAAAAGQTAAAERVKTADRIAAGTSATGTVTAVGGQLDGGQRQQILDTLIQVLGGAYAHLPAKRAAYAVNPVQQLMLLRQRASDLTDADFHLAVTGIVNGLRDAHTRYIAPSPRRGSVAVLPFLVEQYGPYDDPTFLVTKTAPNLIADVDGADSFKPGITVESWNGIPIARAVEIYADRETGGRPDARRARALESLTFRSLDYGPPPDEHWVILGYRADSALHEIRLPWRVVQPGKAETAATPESRAALKVAADPVGEAVRRAKKMLFSPQLWAAEATNEVTPPDQARPSAPGQWLTTKFQDTLAARPLDEHAGYLRVWSFDVDDDGAFLAEVARLLQQLPQDGLVLDLRSNPGGLVWAAERMLQLFTDRDGRPPIVPTRFSLVASPLTRDMVTSPFNRLELEAWGPSLDDSISTGEQYSQPLPLTDPGWCNDMPRAYTGPAVAVVDANTYSSGDLFAAGWVDNQIGQLVVVGQATGAGGANVWTGDQLRDALADTGYAYDPLPGGVGFTVAIRRAIRSGGADGIPIEDLGIGGIPYAMTRRDLEEGNLDLLAFCQDLLSHQT
jgi:C-terminal processing protease CtpA/Prc